MKKIIATAMLLLLVDMRIVVLRHWKRTMLLPKPNKLWYGVDVRLVDLELDLKWEPVEYAVSMKEKICIPRKDLLNLLPWV